MSLRYHIKTRNNNAACYHISPTVLRIVQYFIGTWPLHWSHEKAAHGHKLVPFGITNIVTGVQSRPSVPIISILHVFFISLFFCSFLGPLVLSVLWKRGRPGRLNDRGEVAEGDGQLWVLTGLASMDSYERRLRDNTTIFDFGMAWSGSGGFD